MRNRMLAAVSACAFALAVGVPSALAFDCAVAKKPAEAGAAVLFSGNKVTPLKPNPGTEEKPHGAFFAFTEGEFSGSTFAHAPNGVLPPVREGGPQANCDGKGLDSLEVCFEGSE